jgi:hypothetical protein
MSSLNPYETQSEINEPQPLDMWNRRYQQARVHYGRKYRIQLNCVDYCFFGIFKHLLHIFIFIIIASFFYMALLVSKEAKHDKEYLDSNID